MVNTGGCGSAMEPEEEQKKLSDDMVVFLRKRSETDAPRYTAKLKTYVDFQQKRRRAAAARRNSEHMQCGRRTSAKKTNEIDQRDKSGDNSEQRGEDDRVNKKRGGPVDKGFHGPRSASHSNEPADRCPMRRRVGRRRRSRRRPYRRRRRRSRRRRSRCRRRRRSSRRRRRRSCSRRRRRRSCQRRRRRRRCGC
ncbi:protamine-2-like isoform X2 [Pararge aegeria]|uniref:protamine-2-like isoform X2 n=1 Tax=Pararge aegeria TaxID=116150 RepID=UPI0019D2679D|nr:protamine-2-like isoform X2 [Pararge aegeria]